MIFDKGHLFINEYFYSLQGEGAYSGQAALFIRLAGCAVYCPWCDSPDSWNIANGREMSCDELLQIAIDCGCSIVVITGGEPTMQELSEITAKLKSAGLRVHLETSGTGSLTGEFDWITLSPKSLVECKEEYFAVANELKVVISSVSELEWAEELATKVNGEAKLMLQSEWSVRESIYPLLIDYIKKNNRWQLSVQTHKYLGIE